MKKEILNFKGTYEEAVDYIYHNIDVKEPTEYEFTKVVRYNHKQRKYNGGKWEDEFTSVVRLNDNKHKENLFNKVCMPTIGYEPNFDELGID